MAWPNRTQERRGRVPDLRNQPSLRNELFGRVVGGVLRRQTASGKQVVVRALDNVSLTVNHGDQLGIIGHNGAGKSTMLRVFAGIYEPSQGSITVEGRVSPLFSTSPGLDLDDTGYENIVTCGLLLGMSRDEIERKMPEIEAFSELSDYLALPARTYSAGMLVRLGFAIATAIDPEILLLDEELGRRRCALCHARGQTRRSFDRALEHRCAGLAIGRSDPANLQSRHLARSRPDRGGRADRARFSKFTAAWTKKSSSSAARRTAGNADQAGRIDARG